MSPVHFLQKRLFLRKRPLECTELGVRAWETCSYVLKREVAAQGKAVPWEQ